MTRALVVCLLAIAALARAADDDCLQYEPSVVELRGKLVAEGDDAFALVPDHPFCTHATAGNGMNPAVSGVKRVQLALSDGQKPSEKLLGMHVVARGSLFGARGGILLIAEKVSAAP
ncbi:MAG TPA: hypothetical protein VMR50_21210 [Myxococcota bacterium]|nr:hypothetical protein [Myxococcota bacterium]